MVKSMTSKSIKVYQETTEWTDSNAGNHVYIFNVKISGRSATAIAYIPRGQTKVHKFRTPLKLDLKDRKFEEIT
jgi:hypothetical protein